MPKRKALPVDPNAIPDKPFFKIGEAARLCALKPYVLRYWETEFHSIKPQKTRSRQRLYRRRDVELLLAHPPPALRQAFHHRGRAHPPARAGPRRGRRPCRCRRPEVNSETMRKIKQAVSELIGLVEEP